MIELPIQEGMPIEGKLLKDISGNIIDSVLIGAVERDGELIVPSGNFRLTQGDSIHVIGMIPQRFIILLKNRHSN